MSFSCIQNKNYNFTIDYRKDYIIYTDHSTWVSSTKTTPDTEYKLKIYNGESFKEFTAKINGSIIIKYSELPTSCTSCNFDGVYTFEVTTCMEQQVFQQTAAILVTVTNIYRDLVKEDSNSAFEVLKFIELVKSYSYDGDEENANKFYSLLIKIIKKLNCNCNEQWNL